MKLWRKSCARKHLRIKEINEPTRMGDMGFVITFPGSATKRRTIAETERQTTAEITIFPGVRYERYAPEAPKRAKPKPPRRYFDRMPQPG